MFNAGYRAEKGYTDILTVFFWGDKKDDLVKSQKTGIL